MHKVLQTILFDLDGVLIDTEKLYQCFWVQAANIQGYNMTKEQALQLRSLDSNFAQKLFEQWYKNPSAYLQIRAKRKELMQQYLQDNPLVAKPFVKETLHLLKNKGFNMAVVTAADQDRAISYLQSIGLDSFFTQIISTKTVAKGKPFPDVYLYACEQLDLSPSACFAVEDSPNGVKSAHTAGCRTIMIPDLTPYTDDLTDFVDAHYANLLQFYIKEVEG